MDLAEPRSQSFHPPPTHDLDFHISISILLDDATTLKAQQFERFDRRPLTLLEQTSSVPQLNQVPPHL